jgi:GntR family transcriptional regulator/MocR family aminotransferase
VGTAPRTLIVEDDYDSEYRYDREPIASLQGLAPDCVVHVGTASKTLAPALRLAWVLVPSHLVGEMAAVEALASRMPQTSVGGASAGLHVIAWLPDDSEETAIADTGATRGLAIHTLHQFCAVTAARHPALVLGLGLIADSAIPRAVDELARASALGRAGTTAARELVSASAR